MNIYAADCILCGYKRPQFMSVFIPTNPQKFGAPQGKTRIIHYRICRKCVMSKPLNQLAADVENKLLAELQAEKAHTN